MMPWLVAGRRSDRSLWARRTRRIFLEPFAVPLRQTAREIPRPQAIVSIPRQISFLLRGVSISHFLHYGCSHYSRLPRYLRWLFPSTYSRRSWLSISPDKLDHPDTGTPRYPRPLLELRIDH